MSNENKESKDKEKESEKDKQKSTNEMLENLTDVRSMQYIVYQNINDRDQLKKTNAELLAKILDLEAEVNDLRGGMIRTYETERKIKSLQADLERLTKEKQLETKEFEIQLKKLEEQKREQKHKFDKEIKSLTETNLQLLSKNESLNDLEKQIQAQENRIIEIEKEKNQFKSDLEFKVRQKEIKADIKVDDLKKQMISNIEQTQRNIKNLNLENMEVSTKLTLLQNQQLLIEISYQSEQIAELINKNKKLQDRVYELTKDIEIHKEVELSIADKNKKLSSIIKNYEGINPNSFRPSVAVGENSASASKDNSSNGIVRQKRRKDSNSSEISGISNSNSSKIGSNILINNNVKEFNLMNSFEAKIRKLEGDLSRKQEEFSMLKHNFDIIQEKLIAYETRFTGIFSLFEEGIRRLIDDEEMQNDKEIYLNLDSVRDGNFENFNSQQKYSILIILMKHILPLINSNELQYSEYIKQNFNEIKVKYHFSKNQLNDPLFKRLSNRSSLGPSLKKHPTVSNSDILPLINDSKVMKSKRGYSLSNAPVYV